jgi:hypothetical protein
MRKAANHHVAPPVVTVAQDVYDQILLTDGVIMVADGALQRLIGPGGSTLPNFFTVRRCLVTSGTDSRPPPGHVQPMHRMVGG